MSGGRVRKWVRAHVAIAVLIVGVASAIVTIVGWALPGARDWLVAHPGLGWTLLFLAAFGIAWLLIVNDRMQGLLDQRDESLAKMTDSRDDATRDLAAATSKRATVESERDAARSELEKVASERDTAREERDAAISALHPTARDVDQFRELMEIWDQNGRLMTWLNIGFNARQWTDKDSAALYDFAAVWQHRFFDDPVFNETYQEFFDVVGNLVHWMSSNAGWDRELNRGRGPDDPVIYSVADGDERQGGWPAFDALRDEALKYVASIFELREGLERSGRKRGL